jgi:hypothetical protein
MIAMSRITGTGRLATQARFSGLKLLLAFLLWLVFVVMPWSNGFPCFAQDLDSLASRTDGGTLVVSFLVPRGELKSAGIEHILDDLGLEAECRVSLEVRKSGRFAKFGGGSFTKTVVVRTLRYSRWYDEYVLSENAREILTDRSYYKSLEQFRRFVDLSVVDLGILDPGEEYVVHLELSVRPRPPSQTQTRSSVNVAGVNEVGELAKQGYDFMRKKADLFHLELESRHFASDAVPSHLFGGAEPSN